MIVNKTNKWVGRTNILLTFALLTSLAIAFLAAPFVKEQQREHERQLQREAQAAEVQKRELLWLAKAIYFEARGETKHAGLEGMRVVADVILTRVEDPRWPNTIEAVVRQGEEKPNRCQFSFMCDGKPEHIEDGASFEIATYVASVAYKEFQYTGATSTCAHSYHADYVKRERFAYFMQLHPAEKVGTHIFYCDQEKDAVS